MIDIQSEDIGQRQIQLTIVVSQERIDRAMNEMAQEYARHYRISGYRPGKVPLRAVTARVGEDAVREAAMEKLGEQVVREAVRAEGLVPSAPASYEVLTTAPYTIRVVVPLLPEVTLGDYSELQIESPEPPPVTDEDVTAVIDAWRRDKANLETVDRPAEIGDRMVLALSGRLGDESVFFEDSLEIELTTEGVQKEHLPKDVLDHLVGMAAGEEKLFTVRYSEFWPEEHLRESDVAFAAQTMAVMTLVPPPLDDALAKELGDLDSVEELRERVRAQLEYRSEMHAREAYVTSLVAALVSAADVSYPPIALEQEVVTEIGDLKGRVERQGFLWEKWLELQQTDMESLWQEIEPRAEARLRQRLVLGKFVEVEDIRVDPEEITTEVEKLQAPFTKEARRSLPPMEDLRRSAGSRLLSDRAIERLLELAAAHTEVPEPEPANE